MAFEATTDESCRDHGQVTKVALECPEPLIIHVLKPRSLHQEKSRGIS